MAGRVLRRLSEIPGFLGYLAIHVGIYGGITLGVAHFTNPGVGMAAGLVAVIAGSFVPSLMLRLKDRRRRKARQD